MNASTGTVVVGVDGTTANESALRWAVEEARRAGGPLRLVHVVPDHVPLSPLMPLVPGDLSANGREVLAQVLDTVRRLAPDLELVRAAEDADVLVLGRADPSVLHRLVEGDTATRAAARAPVPVVEVPPGWDGTTGSRGVVLVGVKSPANADDLLGRAFAVARERAARLLVLHAWHLPSAYDDIIEGRVAREQVEREGAAEIDGLLSPWRDVHPGVEVEVRIVHDRPGHALVEASGSADLVVLVRRSHGVPAAAHLGGTARAVLRHAECPVLVVPPTQTTEMPSLRVEAEGQLLR